MNKNQNNIFSVNSNFVYSPTHIPPISKNENKKNKNEFKNFKLELKKVVWPTPKQLAAVAAGKPFQSPSCLLACKRPENFCSVSWDKKVCSCSFAPCKEPLETLDYMGLMEALANVKWRSCNN